jgi:hypothetical protein
MTAIPTMAAPTPIPAFAPMLKPLDGWEVPVCEVDEGDVAEEDIEEVDCVGVEAEEEVWVVVTAVVPTEKVVERLAGAGSENISSVGSLQLTVLLSDSVPQQDQICDALL